MRTITRIWLAAGGLLAAACMDAQTIRGTTTRPNYQEVVKACQAATEAVMSAIKPENACQMTDNEVAAIAKKWVETRLGVCREDPSFYRDTSGQTGRIRDIRDRMCANQKGGPDVLPPFEAALYAMTDARRLNPCTYDPKGDNSAVLNNPQYQSFNSVTAYNNGITFRRFELYVSRTDEASKACFLSLIKSALKGEPGKAPAKGR